MARSDRRYDEPLGLKVTFQAKRHLEGLVFKLRAHGYKATQSGVLDLLILEAEETRLVQRFPKRAPGVTAKTRGS